MQISNSLPTSKGLGVLGLHRNLGKRMGMESSKKTCSQWDKEWAMNCGKQTGLKNLVLSQEPVGWFWTSSFLFRMRVLEPILIGFSTSNFPCFGSKKTNSRIYTSWCMCYYVVSMQELQSQGKYRLLLTSIYPGPSLMSGNKYLLNEQTGLLRIHYCLSLQDTTLLPAQKIRDL